MSKQAEILSRLPELPLEAFELSGKLDYSDRAPVITNRFDSIILPPVVPPPHAPDRSSYETRQYFAWLIYPHVVCTPMPDLEVMARVSVEPGKGPAPRYPGDLAAVANTRLFFKLSQLRGADLATPWACEVKYGPWFGVIDYRQSCYDAVPDRWALSAPGLGIGVEWDGNAEDMPSVPNLTVVWNPSEPAHVGFDCCAGYRMCNGGCLANEIPCPGQPQPV